MVSDAVAVVRSKGAAIRSCTLGTAVCMGVEGVSATPADTSKSWVARARGPMRQQAAVLSMRLRRHA